MKKGAKRWRAPFRTRTTSSTLLRVYACVRRLGLGFTSLSCINCSWITHRYVSHPSRLISFSLLTTLLCNSSVERCRASAACSVSRPRSYLFKYVCGPSTFVTHTHPPPSTDKHTNLCTPNWASQKALPVAYGRSCLDRWAARLCFVALASHQVYDASIYG